MIAATDPVSVGVSVAVAVVVAAAWCWVLAPLWRRAAGRLFPQDKGGRW